MRSLSFDMYRLLSEMVSRHHKKHQFTKLTTIEAEDVLRGALYNLVVDRLREKYHDLDKDDVEVSDE